MSFRAAVRSRLWRIRQRCCEALSIDRYSRPSQHDLDRKLERYLDFDGGFFLEAGAHDGFEQSNTYYFERLRGWRGILVEPVPELYERCRKRRGRSRVVQAALVADDYREATVEMNVAGLMSVTKHAFGDEAKRLEHLRNAVDMRQCSPEGSRTIAVPAMTLSQIIDREAGGREIDLLSLDVEGAEQMALAGLDRRRHSPRFLCVEAREPATVIALMASTHELVEVLTERGRYQDLLFRRRGDSR